MGCDFNGPGKPAYNHNASSDSASRQSDSYATNSRASSKGHSNSSQKDYS